MTARIYPDESAGPFPEPPLSFEDAEDRTIEVREFGGGGREEAAAGEKANADGESSDTGEESSDTGVDSSDTDVDSSDTGVDSSDAGVDALVEMYEAFDPADRAQGIPPTGEGRIRRWLDSILPASVNAVARHDGRVVGHATLVPDEEGGYELAIFVGSDYQGAGIGTKLLRALLGLGRARGVERVWLSVERWNTPAVSLYRSVGFETASAESFELEMSLRLQ